MVTFFFLIPEHRPTGKSYANKKRQQKMASKQTVEVNVSREELDVVSDWLQNVMEGGDAEAEGRKADDNRAAQASELLADYAEQNGDRGADVISVCR
jgi:hypothetical protein